MNRKKFYKRSNSSVLDLFCNYQLPNGKHNIKVVVDKQNVNALLRSWEYIVYSDKKQQSSY